MGTKAERIYHITSARRALSEDVDDRTTRYLVTMVFRTVCFILCAVTPGWYRWLFAAGAILLPMLAVMVANAGREPSGTIDERATGGAAEQHSALPPGSGPVIAPDGSIIESRELAAAPAMREAEVPTDPLSTSFQRARHPEWFTDETEFLR
ncbi:DUF3099 domain-containing protein [Bowdeniella massiliensis]|uniref:DUF3099 domain-containing protein n=1 Tax=Bowdeniella massiliensis TaxID=2932264 RepID=UPI0020292AC9|nr:DUF3099 domain-containing protein [Bowdeniella massiliensis]